MATSQWGFVPAGLVTVGEFAEFVRTEAYFRTELWDRSGPGPGDGGDEVLRRVGYSLKTRSEPVVLVSWFEADAYCRWKGGRLPSWRHCEATRRGRECRVAEWCRGWFNPHDDDDRAAPEGPARRRVAGWASPWATPLFRDPTLGFRVAVGAGTQL